MASRPQAWLRSILWTRRPSNLGVFPVNHSSHDISSHCNGMTASNLRRRREVHTSGACGGFATTLESMPGQRIVFDPRVIGSSPRVISTLGSLQERIKSGKLQPDRAQERVAKKLARLQEALMSYDNTILFQSTDTDTLDSKKNRDEIVTPPKPSTGTDSSGAISASDVAQSKVRTKERLESPQTPKLLIPRGLYIHGPVGTGKTMLMDSFFEACIRSSTDIGSEAIHGGGKNRIRRFHFHNFLTQVHTRIHHLKQHDLKEKGRNFTVDTSLANNPIYRVGLQLASELSVLCLDEFQVTDIADAVILSQLFGVLFQYGTVVVATSNRPPEDLYEGGLNRGYFLPFIDLLKKHCIVHRIGSDQDYRRVMASCSSFFVTNDPTKLDALIEEIAREVCGANVDEPQSIQLTLGYQRSLVVHRAYKEAEGGIRDDNAVNDDRDTRIHRNVMGCFRFEELCDSEMGAKDYRAVAKAFDIVVLENIPTLDLEGHNRARRFITLIDELYEARCALLCSTVDAETPMELFSGRGQSRDGEPPSNETVVDTTRDGDNDVADVMWVDVAQQGGTPVGALASVRELSFAFDRASSRIYEMCSKSWWDRVLNKQA